MSSVTVRVRSEADATEASRISRELALQAGLGTLDAVQLATAVSEIATNQLRHAGGGEITIDLDETGVVVEARDSGPGIDDIEHALRDGYSTINSLGLGLPGARRLTDEFELTSTPGSGTTVRMAKRAGTAPAERLAEWACAGEHAAMRAVCRPVPNGLMLAIAGERAAAWLEHHPAAPPAHLLDHAGSDPAVVAQISGLDGHLSWLRSGPSDGALLRRRRSAVAVVATPSLRRAKTLGARRGDMLVLVASGPMPDQITPAPPAAMAEQVMRDLPAPNVVVVARLERGVFERRARPR